jgi:hypothetical protein
MPIQKRTVSGAYLVNFSVLDRLVGLRITTIATAQIMTIVLTTAASVVDPPSEEVRKLKQPCQTATIKMLPAVLLVSHVKRIAPANKPMSHPTAMLGSNK